MVANRGTVTTVASWLVFVPALALSLIASFLILNAAALWGLGRTIAAGPAFVLVFVYVTSMPVVFGALGLWKATPRRRLVVGLVMLLSLTVYMFVAAGESFDWF
jgi:hypothetical protein